MPKRRTTPCSTPNQGIGAQAKTLALPNRRLGSNAIQPRSRKSRTSAVTLSSMEHVVHIGKAAELLAVTPFDVALLRAPGVGSRPRRLKSPEGVAG